MKDLALQVNFVATQLSHTHPLTTPPPLCFSFQTFPSPHLSYNDTKCNTIHFNVHDDGLDDPRSIPLPCELLVDPDDGDCNGHIMAMHSHVKLYMVIFRSKRSVSADTELLYQADAEAKQEAMESGGLLLYWYGTMNERRECLATCIWRSREDALEAVKLPKHMFAAKLAHQMYDTYELEKYWLIFSGAKIYYQKIQSVTKHY